MQYDAGLVAEVSRVVRITSDFVRTGVGKTRRVGRPQMR
jgi:hypothetical protein